MVWLTTLWGMRKFIGIAGVIALIMGVGIYIWGLRSSLENKDNIIQNQKMRHQAEVSILQHNALMYKLALQKQNERLEAVANEANERADRIAAAGQRSLSVIAELQENLEELNLQREALEELLQDATVCEACDAWMILLSTSGR